MLLCIHVVPARRDRFEVRVRAAAEQLARRLARGLSAAPRLAGGEGHASRAARSDYCEPSLRCHVHSGLMRSQPFDSYAPPCAAASVQHSSVQCVQRSAAITDAISTRFDSCALQMSSMGVRCRQATAMLSNDSSPGSWAC